MLQIYTELFMILIVRLFPNSSLKDFKKNFPLLFMTQIRHSKRKVRSARTLGLSQVQKRREQFSTNNNFPIVFLLLALLFLVVGTLFRNKYLINIHCHSLEQHTPNAIDNSGYYSKHIIYIGSVFRYLFTLFLCITHKKFQAGGICRSFSSLCSFKPMNNLPFFFGSFEQHTLRDYQFKSGSLLQITIKILVGHIQI